MKNFIKTYYKTLLFFGLVGLVGGYFTGIYLLDSYPAEIKDQITAQGITAPILGLITGIQSACYGIVLGALGIILGKKIGLWRDEKAITKKPLITSVTVALIGGIVMILSDILFFSRYSEAITDSYAAKPSIPYMLATVSYGAVIEEIMLRLFAMSLIAFILYMLFDRKKDKPSVTVLAAANIISAMLFAAGHLPAAFILIGNSPLIIFRCFFLNGGLGLLFGYLYRKYGLRYAMIAHGGCHVVSKLIWILFI